MTKLRPELYVGREQTYVKHFVLENYLELEAKIKKSNADLESSVDVAAIYSVGLSDMGQLVERFKALQPHARVQQSPAP